MVDLLVIVAFIIFEYVLFLLYQVSIKEPWRRRNTRGVIFLTTGIIIAMVVLKYGESTGLSLLSPAFIAGITAIFPLFSLQGKSIRGETKWRQDLKNWITSKNINRENSKEQLLRLLRASISPEAVRFVDENFDKGGLYLPNKALIKPRLCFDKIHVVMQNNDTLGEIAAPLGSEPVFRPYKESDSFGRISAIDLYVAVKVRENETNEGKIDQTLLDLVSVLLKYDWDYTNEKKPMFFWTQRLDPAKEK